MLRNFAAALIATALVAGPAFAAQPSSSAGTSPAAPAVAAAPAAPANIKGQNAIKQTEVRKPVKTVKHAEITCATRGPMGAITSLMWASTSPSPAR